MSACARHGLPVVALLNLSVGAPRRGRRHPQSVRAVAAGRIPLFVRREWQCRSRSNSVGVPAFTVACQAAREAPAAVAGSAGAREARAVAR